MFFKLSFVKGLFQDLLLLVVLCLCLFVIFVKFLYVCLFLSCFEYFKVVCFFGGGVCSVLFVVYCGLGEFLLECVDSFFSCFFWVFFNIFF